MNFKPPSINNIPSPKSLVSMINRGIHAFYDNIQFYIATQIFEANRDYPDAPKWALCRNFLPLILAVLLNLSLVMVLLLGANEIQDFGEEDFDTILGEGVAVDLLTIDEFAQLQTNAQVKKFKDIAEDTDRIEPKEIEPEIVEPETIKPDVQVEEKPPEAIKEVTQETEVAEKTIEESPPEIVTPVEIEQAALEPIETPEIDYSEMELIDDPAPKNELTAEDLNAKSLQETTQWQQDQVAEITPVEITPTTEVVVENTQQDKFVAENELTPLQSIDQQNIDQQSEAPIDTTTQAALDQDVVETESTFDQNVENLNEQIENNADDYAASASQDYETPLDDNTFNDNSLDEDENEQPHHQSTDDFAIDTPNTALAANDDPALLDQGHFIDDANRIADEFDYGREFESNHQVDAATRDAINQQIYGASGRPTPQDTSRYSGMTGAEIDAAYAAEQAAKRRLPNVDLPDQYAAGSGGDGTGGANMIGADGIYCPDYFEDPDKIAECAGRPEILSGWTYENSGADFSGIATSLRRGSDSIGVTPNPNGPNANQNMGRADQYYEPDNLAAKLGPRQAAAIEQARAESYMRDPTRSVEQHQGANASTNDSFDLGPSPIPRKADAWEPSWSMRDDPIVDQELIDELMEDKERKRRRNDDDE